MVEIESHFQSYNTLGDFASIPYNKNIQKLYLVTEHGPIQV
jgi:hypothetical protein